MLAAISLIAYSLLFFSGPNIARNVLGESATPEQIARLEAELGLDQPLLVRYGAWVVNALSGNLGRSWFNSESVVGALATRLPITLTLVTVSMVLVALIATALGIAAAARGGWVDRMVQIGAVIGDAIPGFVLSIILVTIFAIQLRIFPAISTIGPTAPIGAWVASLTLPVIAIVLNYVTSGAQQIRSAVRSQLQLDYVRTLRSRGISEREILFTYVLRNAAPTGLTVISLQFVGLLGAVVIIETIFAIPGMGTLAVSSTSLGDIPVVMGVVIATVVIVIIVNLLVDLANGWLNPKIRLS
ncbi:ABC transporter permease [Microbacterium sp.]|uniref:ABC transporter permease n=1 Tax=Microbacterium sp. TaxID=51671 RepID=UPI0037C68988